MKEFMSKQFLPAFFFGATGLGGSCEQQERKARRGIWREQGCSVRANDQDP